MKKHRMARVSEMIREVASETILFKMSDPRVKRVTVMSVEVSPDLQHARVKVSVMGTPAQQATTLKGLQHAAGFIQAQMGDRMKSRFTPCLRFELDQGVKQSVEISRLINEALSKSPSMNASSDINDSSDIAEDDFLDNGEDDDDSDFEDLDNDHLGDEAADDDEVDAEASTAKAVQDNAGEEEDNNLPKPPPYKDLPGS
jgi:ribosome-binding factor A